MHNKRVKIITGMRRVGKSFLLFNIFKDYLLKKVTNKKHVIEILINSPKMSAWKNEPIQLLSYIKAQIHGNKTHYILMDEIQEVKDFQMILLDLLNDNRVDLYVTGSNSKFLSSDIVTQFRGRGYEIHLYPFSFADILPLFGNNFNKAWKNYYTYGGLPEIYVNKNTSDNEKIKFLNDVLDSTYLLDLKERHRIDRPVELKELLSVMGSSVGSYVSTQNIVNTFKSNHRALKSRGTIEKYLEYMQESFLIDVSYKYNIKGRRQIGSSKKYYFEDVGIRNAATGFREIEESHLLENIVFLELKQRFSIINVGEVEFKTDIKEKGKRKTVRQYKEIDFVINMAKTIKYIQVSLNIDEADTLKREIDPFAYIKHQGKNYLVYKSSKLIHKNINKIKCIKLKQFLLNDRTI